jgi:hypothetical protein
MKKIAPHLPLVIITGLMIYSIYVVSTGNIVFSYEHYIGLALILLSIATFRYSPFVSRAATFFALFLGTFSQAAFTAVITRYRMGYTIGGKGLDIILQPYCLLLLILFMVLNWGFFKNNFRKKLIA